MVNRLGAMRRPGESYSDVSLRISRSKKGSKANPQVCGLNVQKPGTTIRRRERAARRKKTREPPDQAANLLVPMGAFPAPGGLKHLFRA
jgi:hypothetical protein